MYVGIFDALLTTALLSSSDFSDSLVFNDIVRFAANLDLTFVCPLNFAHCVLSYVANYQQSQPTELVHGRVSCVSFLQTLNQRQLLWLT